MLHFSIQIVKEFYIVSRVRWEAKWQNEVEGIKEEIEKQKKLRELRNIWTGNKQLISITKEDSINKKVSFKLQVDTISDVGFQVSASYKFLKGNEKKNNNK